MKSLKPQLRRYTNNLRLDGDDIPPPPRWPLHREGDAMLLARIYVRYQLEQLTIVAVRVLEQHQRRVTLGASVALDTLSVQQLDDYIKNLKAVENQSGFPYSVEWPEVPACLRQNIIT